MFCPEDSAEIPMIDSHSPRVPDSYHGYYDPCPECGTVYWYDGDRGEYRTDGPEIPPQEVGYLVWPEEKDPLDIDYGPPYAESEEDLLGGMFQLEED